MTPPARGNFRERLKTRLRAKVRAWITGHQIVHWDEGDERLTWEHTSYPILRTMRAYPGEPGEMHIGKYTGFHYTALLIPGGLHHTDWVGTLHAHVDEKGDWVFHDGSVFSKGPINIGNDCYVGYEAIITSGVTVGDGAVIAARAVITKDVEPYAIMAGNPGPVGAAPVRRAHPRGAAPDQVVGLVGREGGGAPRPDQLAEREGVRRESRPRAGRAVVRALPIRALGPRSIRG